MQKSEFPKMRHYVGFWQIGSHNYVYSLIKLDFKTQVSTEVINLKLLVAPSLCLSTTAQDLRIINSVDPCVLKSNYYLFMIGMVGHLYFVYYA